jgi:uncharacterized membrane protein YoaK (UPF0700 family)
MMKHWDRVLLTLVAGFCDAATFVHMHGIFSAHVTGNFILFAAALTQGVHGGDFLKILTFPVFLFAVVAGTFIHRPVTGGTAGQSRIYIAISLILWGAAVLSPVLIFVYGTTDLGYWDAGLTMVIVFAMGMQNSLHHFVSGPMTTVMTGTVMNAAASFGERLFFPKSGDGAVVKMPMGALNPIWMIFGFAGGCFGGAVSSYFIGYASMIAPALVMSLLAYLTFKKSIIPT